MEKQRARTSADKATRREQILDAGRGCLDDAELDEFTMDAVAASLGLAKGTLYRYVPTREALLLAILEDDLGEWFDAVDAKLPTLTGARRLTNLLVSTLTARPRLMRVLSVLQSVLERNVPHDTALEFKLFLLHRSAITGRLIDAALSAKRGSGVHLLVHLHAGVIGLSNAAHPAPVVATVLAEPRFAPLRVDLRRELTHLVDALIAAIPVTATPAATAASLGGTDP